MKQIVLHKGTKAERTYNLDLDFNAIADSDVMEQFAESLSVVREFAPQNDARVVVPQDHRRKVRKIDKEEQERIEREEAEKNIERVTTFLPAVRKLFASTRAILHSCLQTHHAEEFPTVADTGKLIEEMVSPDENGNREWDIMSVFTLAQESLQNAASLASLLGMG